MIFKINPDNPEGRKIRQVVEKLDEGGVIIYPTDTVYGIGCDIFNQKAVEKVCRIRGLDPRKAMLSFICKDISQIAEFSAPIDNATFRVMKKNLPGPFTFVLKSNNSVPKLLKNKKRTIGVRVPNHNIPLQIVESLGRPLLTASLKSDDEILEYFTDPVDIYDDFKNQVDIVIDAGPGGNQPSTVIDCMNDLPEIIREGVGELQV